MVNSCGFLKKPCREFFSHQGGIKKQWTSGRTKRNPGIEGNPGYPENPGKNDPL